MLKQILTRVLAFVLCILSLSFSFGQSRKISDTVTDQKGAVLFDATITVKETQGTTTTIELGKFSLYVPSNAKTLVVTYVDMAFIEKTINTESGVKINLSPNNNPLNEVVVVGYGGVKIFADSLAASLISFPSAEPFQHHAQ